MDILDNSNKNNSLNNIVLICIKSVANNPTKEVLGILH